MTPFRNDEHNPFRRRSAWPTLPQTPLPVRRWKRPALRTPGVDEVIMLAGEAEPEIWASEPWLEARPAARRAETAVAVRPRRRPRLMPLLVSGSLGILGLATLFVVLVRP